MSDAAERGERPLTKEEHHELLNRPRPRKLPIAPDAPPPKRQLPLTGVVTPVDNVRPIYCVWEITLACDLACRHCGSRAGHARPEELTTSEALELSDQLLELGVKEVTLIGGEAYLRPDWLQIVRRLSDGGAIVTMTTGGRGITPAMAEDAARAGLRAASVSVDGLAAVHDRLRGVKGSFQAALRSMGHLKAAGLRVFNNTQINRLNLPELRELFELLADQGTEAWQFMLTVPMGRAVDEPDVMLQPYDLLELFPTLAELAEQAKERGIFIWRGNNLGYFGPYEAMFRGFLPGGHGGSCGAGKTTIGIEADGTIKGCPSLGTRKWAAGNSRDARLEEIWTRAEPIRYTRYRTVEKDLWGYCAACYYADTCRAGCTWMTDMLFDRPGNNPYCHHRALEMARLGKRERVRRVREAPGEPFDQGLFELIEEPLPEAPYAGAPRR